MAVNLQTIKDFRNYLESELKGLYHEGEARAIADTVILKALRLTSLPELMMRQNEKPDDQAKEQILVMCGELKTGMPVQYVTGETYFLGCIIKVNPGVLIPRPETEEMTWLIINENKGFRGGITDMCTGSGCIAIALAVHLPDARITASDISAAALRTARENALANNADVAFFRSDILKMPPSLLPLSDIIVSNPPYVRNSEKTQMRKNVLLFEPPEALFVPDEDPLKFYRAILDTAENSLRPGGTVYFEINEALGRDIYDLMKSNGYTDICIYKDINGRDRVAKGKRK